MEGLFGDSKEKKRFLSKGNVGEFAFFILQENKLFK